MKLEISAFASDRLTLTWRDLLRLAITGKLQGRGMPLDVLIARSHRCLLLQMIMPDVPAPGSIWIDRGLAVRRHRHEVVAANRHGVEYRLVSLHGGPKQPSDSAHLRDFHCWFVPEPPGGWQP